MTATPDITIREATQDDAPQVIAVWHAAGVTRPWNDPEKDFAFALKGAHSTVLVGALSDRIVATAMVGEDGHRGWVHYLAIDPPHQKGGLGRAMMEAAETWLARRGIWKVQLLIREDNAAAQGFYERLGYRDTRTVCLQKVIA